MWPNEQPGRKESIHFGGKGGSAVDFTQNSNLSLMAVRGRQGQFLDQIQFLFEDSNTGQYIESPKCGGKGGSEWMFQAPPG